MNTIEVNEIAGTAGIEGTEGIKGTVKDEAKNQKNIRKFWAGFHQKADGKAIFSAINAKRKTKNYR